MEREILHVNLSWWFPEDEDLVALRVAVGGGRRRRVRVPIRGRESDYNVE